MRIDVDEGDLRRIIREELARMFASAGLARRHSLQTPCAFCKADIARPCEHYEDGAERDARPSPRGALR